MCSSDLSNTWLMPIEAARVAALIPAGPEPTIATLYVVTGLYHPLSQNLAGTKPGAHGTHAQGSDAWNARIAEVNWLAL